MFQSLIGRLKTYASDGDIDRTVSVFQSLIGRLKTDFLNAAHPKMFVFQSLIGRLKTRYGTPTR